MTTADDLIVVFLALEILSIPLYVLAAFDRRRLASQEAGIKYFVLGAFSSAVFLYGVALVYGATGTTSLTGIAAFLAANTLLEEGMLLVGIGAAPGRPRLQGRGGAVPHVDARRVPGCPDAGDRVHVVGHQGRRLRRPAARVPGGVPAVPRRLAPGRRGARDRVTLVVGSVAAVVQNDVKRMLAYSSIAHAGLRPHRRSPRPRSRRRRGRPRLQSALFYLLVYAFMTIGAFAVVMWSPARRTTPATRSTTTGGWRPRPVLAALLAFFLLAQAGVPFTGGFVAKLQVFAAAVDAARVLPRHRRASLAAVVAAFFYLRIVVTMFVG